MTWIFPDRLAFTLASEEGWNCNVDARTVGLYDAIYYI